MYYIYILLGGEHDSKPRSKKLLKLVQKNNQFSPYSVICAGFTSFNTHRAKGESEEMSEYLQKKGIPKENIILENRSLDTLGNLVFSYPIVSHKILQTHDEVKIVLITEGFHMARAKSVFKRLFHPLESSRVKFEFAKANTMGLSSFFWKRSAKVIFGRLNNFVFPKNAISNLEKNSLQVTKKYVLNFVIMDAIFADIKRFHLKNFSDFKDYMFALPVYNEKYNASDEMKHKIKQSLYYNLIKIRLSK
ncbi:YdcF family protein [Candidatus Woesearchaeota archaeon]|nr:YdcF family protein [Candidatus Woesearchaeota archaeon]